MKVFIDKKLGRAFDLDDPAFPLTHANMGAKSWDEVWEDIETADMFPGFEVTEAVEIEVSEQSDGWPKNSEIVCGWADGFLEYWRIVRDIGMIQTNGPGRSNTLRYLAVELDKDQIEAAEAAGEINMGAEDMGLRRVKVEVP